MNDALQALRKAFAWRTEPLHRIREGLHPMDHDDAVDCCADLAAGKNPSLIFQSAIPYYAFFTNEFRAFLFPDYLVTLLDHPSAIFSVNADLSEGRGQTLLLLFTPDEHDAAVRFLTELSPAPEMEWYREEMKELSLLLNQAKKSGRNPNKTP